MRSMLKCSFIFLGLLLSAPILAADPEDLSPLALVVMDFSKPISFDSLGSGWQHKKFFRTTPMSMSLEENDGYHAIRLETKGGGSILGRNINITLESTPIFAWSWKVTSPIEVEDETTAKGDDHPARLFLSFDKPESRSRWDSLKDWFIGLIHGISYHGRAFEIVWGNNLKGGELYYIYRFPHYVKRGGKQHINKWWDEEVDIEELYHRIWPNERVPHLLFIGLMNDSEIARQKAVSYFANVRFLRK